MELPALRLKPGEERRLLSGHLWVFSNELETLPKDIAPGSFVEVRTAGGSFVGIGAYSPHSLISIRLLSFEREPIGQDFFASRVRRAIERRRNFSPQATSYRLIFSESDGLPGLVVDRYEDILVIQSHSFGTDAWLPLVVDALKQEISPRGVLLRNDSGFRDIEGLGHEVKCLWGEVPKTIEIRQNGMRFLVNPWSGHKTGFYLDQSENREAAAKYVKGARVLDAFCYTGAFAITCALAGAREVVGVDSSKEAIELARENAKLNGVADRCQFVESDVFEYLESGRDTFDAVLLDPPSFVKNKRQLMAGLRGYAKLNAQALTRLSPEGILVSSSCSHHVDAVSFRAAIKAAAEKAKANLWLLEWRSQSRDHPILLSMPETEYLKFAIFSRCPS